MAEVLAVGRAGLEPATLRLRVLAGERTERDPRSLSRSKVLPVTEKFRVSGYGLPTPPVAACRACTTVARAEGASRSRRPPIAARAARRAAGPCRRRRGTSPRPAGPRQPGRAPRPRPGVRTSIRPDRRSGSRSTSSSGFGRTRAWRKIAPSWTRLLLIVRMALPALRHSMSRSQSKRVRPSGL
jgi:hypothetical protein